MIYFCLLIFLILLEYLMIFNTKFSLQFKRNLFLGLVFAEISLFIGLRDELSSVDTAYYLNYFYDIGNSVIFSTFRIDKFEKGYTYLNQIVYWIFGYRPIILLTIIGALTIGPILWTIRKRDFLLVSVLTWCIMNGLTTAIGNQRQGLALGWCLLGYYYIMDRKNPLAVIFILIASSFHFSAICMLATIPLYYVAKKLKFNFAYFLGLILPTVIGLIFCIRPLLIFLSEASGMYGSYLNRHNSALGAVLYCCATGAIFIVAYIIYYYRYKYLLPRERTNFKFLLLMSLLGFVMYCATLHSGSNRMALYFTCIYIWLFPLILTTLEYNKQWKSLATIGIYTGLCIMLISFYIFPSSFELAKYTPIFTRR